MSDDAKATPKQIEARIAKEIAALRSEALSYGYVIEGDKLLEVRKAMADIRADRANKPACFKRAYAEQAAACQICDLRYSCGGEQNVPAYVPPTEIRTSPCTLCGGQLDVELLDEASGAVRDYGCSAEGCPQTLLRQTQWSAPAATVEDVDVEGDAPKRRMRAPKLTDDEIDALILRALAEHGPLRTFEQVSVHVGRKGPRIGRRLKALQLDGRVEHSKDGYQLPPKEHADQVGDWVF